MVMLFDADNLPENVYGLVFSTRQQEVVARMLINLMKESGSEINKAQMSNFATRLHEGTIILEVESGFQKRTVKISYNKKQFYERILNPLKSMGMIEYDLHKKVYRLNSKFARTLNHIGTMWLEEMRKPAVECVLTVN